ncbi:hypothetical protein ACWDUN_24945 [Mycobacterium sp. NPDC003323]
MKRPGIAGFAADSPLADVAAGGITTCGGAAATPSADVSARFNGGGAPGT